MATKTQKIIAEFRRKNSFANRMEDAVHVDMLSGLKTFKSKITVPQIEAAIASKTTDKLVERLPWDALDAKLGKASKRILKAAVESAKGELHKLPRDFRYDLKNPNFANYIRDHTGNLITLVQEDTRKIVRAAVRNAFNKGHDPRDVAMQIRSSIGLNERQANALSKYRNSLADAGHAPARVTELANAYGERLLSQRAMTVARTEIRFAANAGQQQIWKAASKADMLPPAAMRRWVVDGNPCEICEPMDGVTVGVDEDFRLPDGTSIDQPPAHPNCFCIVSLDVGDYHPGFAD